MLQTRPSPSCQSLGPDDSENFSKLLYQAAGDVPQGAIPRIRAHAGSPSPSPSIRATVLGRDTGLLQSPCSTAAPWWLFCKDEDSNPLPHPQLGWEVTAWSIYATPLCPPHGVTPSHLNHLVLSLNEF